MQLVKLTLLVNPGGLVMGHSPPAVFWFTHTGEAQFVNLSNVVSGPASLGLVKPTKLQLGSVRAARKLRPEPARVPPRRVYSNLPSGVVMVREELVRQVFGANVAGALHTKGSACWQLV